MELKNGNDLNLWFNAIVVLRALFMETISF